MNFNLNKIIKNKLSFFRNKLHHTNDRFSHKGLTLIELMVVVSIFIIISGMVILNGTDFKSNTSLENLTNDIALALRKAQGYAIGARGFESNGDKIFTNKYGIHFSTADLNSNNKISGSNKYFILSSSSDEIYDVPLGNDCSTGECVELFNLTGLNKIKSISYNNGSSYNAESMDITFTRPGAEATFCYKVSNICKDKDTISSVSIVISNGRVGNAEKTRIITVQSTGQISTN